MYRFQRMSPQSSSSRRTARVESPVAMRLAVGLAPVALALAASAVHAAAPTTAPQVLLAITNSESMDGTTAGAIMVGSGSQTLYPAATWGPLTNSSSPTSYTVPTGFVPPVTGGTGTQPYTSACGSNQCDNGPSRLNMTKASIQHVLSTYGNSLNFGLYTYKYTSTPSVYFTYVYYMSAAGGGFTFQNTSSSSTVVNPCYNYQSMGASTYLRVNCTALVTANIVTGTVLNTNQYMVVGATSDNPLINDVFYTSSAGSSGQIALTDTWNGNTPANPYTNYTLANYNSGNFGVTYNTSTPQFYSSTPKFSTGPTNAAYVPYSPHVMYVMRGFGYYGAQDNTTGLASVPMSTDPTSSTFTNALQPETNSNSTPEIKAAAVQSGIPALMSGAKTYLNNFTHQTCQSQYVVLLTDGLPTLALDNTVWPPLGTTTATQYSVTATFNADGSFSTSNSTAVTDTITTITALKNAGVKVFVIGLGAGVDPSVNPMADKVLKAMAIAGGTSVYYPATDPASLDTAFQTIVSIIYNEAAVSAPVAPISVAGGGAYEYLMSSIAVPGAGHVKAYSVAADGTPSTTMAWDAATLMNASNRKSSLLGTTATNTIDLFDNLDAAAFSIPVTPTACVPSATWVKNFTYDPSLSGPTGGSCTPTTNTYLGTRRASWYLGVFSTQNTGQFLSAPNSGLLSQKYSTYNTYARAQRTSRPTEMMFTDADGFLYSINPTTGALNWGWTSRPLTAKLQNYSSFASSGATDGGFRIVDAMDAGSTWATYIVGAFQGGAEHYILKIDNVTGKPNAQVYDNVISGSVSAAGDKAPSAIGNGPSRQTPVVAYIGNYAYYVYATTVGTTSTLWETNVATGATTSATMPCQVSSVLSLNDDSNTLMYGCATGEVYMHALKTGNAAVDVPSVAAAITGSKIGITKDPSNGNVAVPVYYAQYAEVSGVRLIITLNKNVLTIWGVSGSGWAPLWATTPTQGYTYSGGAFVTSATVTKLTASSVVSDAPLLLNTALLLPVYVPSSGCTDGHGWYDFFDLLTGKFPTDLPIPNITADMDLGLGQALTPSMTRTTNGISLNPQAKDQTTPQTPLNVSNTLNANAISWRRR